MPANKNYLRVVICATVFTLCGLCSSWLFTHPKSLFMGFYSQGLIYTLATIIVFQMLRIKLLDSKLLTYTVTMYAAYMLMFHITLISLEYSAFVGILTGGFGAICSFILAQEIKPFVFKNRMIFIYGALPFVINDILLIEPLSSFIWPENVLARRSFISIPHYGITFFLWQTIVGLSLYFHLTRKETDDERNWLEWPE